MPAVEITKETVEEVKGGEEVMQNPADECKDADRRQRNIRPLQGKKWRDLIAVWMIDCRAQGKGSNGEIKEDVIVITEILAAWTGERQWEW